MQRLWLMLALMILLGGGCKDASEPQALEARDDKQIILAEDFTLELDPSYAFQKDARFIRVQNYVSHDDPNFSYAPGSFFLEIYGLSDMTEDKFADLHGFIDQAVLDGEEVLRGTDRAVAENSWPGHSYLHPDRHVVIYLYYQDSQGGDAAENIVQTLRWK